MYACTPLHCAEPCVIRVMACLQGERETTEVRKPTIVGLYPTSFQHGDSVPPNMDTYCFPDDDVLLKKMQMFPLAPITSSCTGYGGVFERISPGWL